jgi:hypothetical protein
MGLSYRFGAHFEFSCASSRQTPPPHRQFSLLDLLTRAVPTEVAAALSLAPA